MQTRLGSAPSRLRSLPTWLISQLALASEPLPSARLVEVGAHRRHFSLLAALEEYGPASQIELGRRCGIDQSDVVAALDTLEPTGALTRTPDTTDRLRKVVTITGEGRARLRQLDEVLGRVQEDLLAPLTSAERDQLVQLLVRVLDNSARS